MAIGASDLSLCMQSEAASIVPVQNHPVFRTGHTLDVSKLVVHLEIAPHSGVAIATSSVIPSASHLFLSLLETSFLLLFLPGPPLLFSLFNFPFSSSCRCSLARQYILRPYPFLPFLTFPCCVASAPPRSYSVLIAARFGTSCTLHLPRTPKWN